VGAASIPRPGRSAPVDTFAGVLKLPRRRRPWSTSIRHWNGVAPAPPFFKHRVIVGYGKHYGIRSFVETGTYMGDTVSAVRFWFKEIHTVELSPMLAAKSRRRFQLWKNIHVYEGNSVTLLPEILSSLSGPAVFWLDAHYSQSDTTRGAKETPIEEELGLLLRHPFAPVILIDDARLFGDGDYPSLERVEQLATAEGKTMNVDLDIIRLTDKSV
jgi:hypothetical protein